MVFADGFVGLVLFGVWVFCIIDAITTPPEQHRNLPKIAWIIIVILLVDLGSVLWLVAGRSWNRTDAVAVASSSGQARSGPARSRATNPDDDEDFQRVLRQRADEQRRRARNSSGDETPPGSTPDGV